MRETPPVFVTRARLFSYLVTRQTGRTVRLSIERELADRDGLTLTILDFRDVSVIDFSCADEVVAKLAGAALPADGSRRARDGEEPLPDDGSPGERFFLFAGLEEGHVDPVESALRRRALVVAAERSNGEPCLLGSVDERARRAWSLVCRRGRVDTRVLAAELGLGTSATRGLLTELHGHRLLVRRGGDYLSLRHAISEARSGEPES